MQGQLVWSILFSTWILARAEIVCNSNVCGRPRGNDCGHANLYIKGAPTPGSQEDLKIRFFAEPQFFNPPFSPLSASPWDVEIVQLPKIWRFGM